MRNREEKIMLVDINRACLIIFNMQLELVPLVWDNYQLAHDARWLADLCHTHGIPTILTQHKKLGDLLPSVKAVTPSAQIFEKSHFSVVSEPHILNHLHDQQKNQLILAGAESHVCLLQSAIKLNQLGYEVFVVSDAISARSPSDNQAAINRLSSYACELISKDMIFFELIEHSERSNYLDLALKFLDGRYIQ